MTQADYLHTPVEFRDGGLYCCGVAMMAPGDDGYMRQSVREICQRVHPRRVLEVGYGLGITADEFDRYELQRHYIVEPHPTILASATRQHRLIIENFIQNIQLDEDFDLIYDDRDDFTQGYVNWGNFRYRWYATMPQLTPMRSPYFTFRHEERTYYQPLVANAYRLA